MALLLGDLDQDPDGEEGEDRQLAENLVEDVVGWFPHGYGIITRAWPPWEAYPRRG